MTVIREGEADIIVEKGVFFNPKMQDLRSLSVEFLRSFDLNGKSLLDCTTATGVRGIRYAKETNISRLVLLDMNKRAFENAAKNVRRNRLGSRVTVMNRSIQDFVNANRKTFEVVDLDPFGSPTPHINDILRASSHGTLLMITATDTAVLCGAHSSACVKNYHSKPLHSELCKESGIRILINYILRSAAEFNYGVEILMCVSDMHYMRVFLRLNRGAEYAINSIKETGFGAFCRNCHIFDYSKGIVPEITVKCMNCNARLDAFGPLYLGRLYDKKVLDKMLYRRGHIDERIKNHIRLLSEEFDTPFFYAIPKITKYMGRGSVSHRAARDRLKDEGYHATFTQFDRDGIKTDAPIEEVIKAIKEIRAR